MGKYHIKYKNQTPDDKSRLSNLELSQSIMIEYMNYRQLSIPDKLYKQENLQDFRNYIEWQKRVLYLKWLKDVAKENPRKS